MIEKPFWEKTYEDICVSTFAKGPTKDIEEYYKCFSANSVVLDVGCGEGRNAIFLAGKGHLVNAFDVSEAGISKARLIAKERNVDVNFIVQDAAIYVFNRSYDIIMSHGVLHLLEKEVRNEFIKKAKVNTNVGGYNIIGIFTNRLPATPDNAQFTKSLFYVAELPNMYGDWDIINHEESTFKDEHPGGIKHAHAYERIIARKK